MNEEPKRLVRVLRGVPGCGKSTFISELEAVEYRHGNVWEVFSADDFFRQETGVYQFDPLRIGEAHAWCFKRFLTRLTCQGDVGFLADLFVDNTNIRAYEIAPYILAANAHGYDHEIVTLVCDPGVAFLRNTHGVPAEVVWAQHRALLAESLPPFWRQRVVYCH